ncbi:hypothetical protein ACOI1C_14800 [Bacillus sp. DJP31]|uniref:hypothetical protein n=1 Tax=Bacillus sp. DJP31 TaxID=3409789 RepID=UPI003BB48C5B
MPVKPWYLPENSTILYQQDNELGSEPSSLSINCLKFLLQTETKNLVKLGVLSGPCQGLEPMN